MNLNTCDLPPKALPAAFGPPTNHRRRCAICGREASELLYRREFACLSSGLLDGYDVVACDSCGFCFASDLPNQAAFDAYYAHQSKYEHSNRSGKQSEFDTRRRPFTVSLISSWLPDRNAAVLDIGCANGDLLAEMKKQGYHNVLGLDPSPACGRTAKELYGIEVATAPISKIPADLGRFDLVILASALEHILDLNGSLANVRNLIKPGGAVFVEVPDMTRCSLMKDAPFQEFSLEHINYFSPTSLENLWCQHGFKTIGMRQTDIDQTPGLTLYEIKAMFQLVGSTPTRKLEPDTRTKPELTQYIHQAEAKLKSVALAIDELVRSQEPIIIWGVGTLAQSLMATSRLKEANIRAFVDSNPRYLNQKLNGIPILAVAALAGRPETILVCSQQFQKEIIRQIRSELRLNNPIVTLC